MRGRGKSPATSRALAAHRREHAGPILAASAYWLAGQAPRVLPKAAIGEAVPHAMNRWSSLVVSTRAGQLTIDNGPAEQAIRPLAVGRRNWLHVGGDGGLRPTAVMLGLAASVKRHGVNPWAYLKHVLTELPARPPGANLSDLLPSGWAHSCARANPAAPHPCRGGDSPPAR